MELDIVILGFSLFSCGNPVTFDFLKRAVQLHAGLNKRLDGKLSDHHESIFKSV